MNLNSLKKYVLGSIVLLSLIGAAFSSPAFAAKIDGADQGGRPFYTDMNGAEEIPPPGDPDGTGTAYISLNQGQSLICFALTVENIAQATGAHIHEGAAGDSGSVLVTLTAPATGSSSWCVEVDRDLIKAIRQSPSEFYVNVHNAEFSAGAIRGQLGD